MCWHGELTSHLTACSFSFFCRWSLSPLKTSINTSLSGPWLPSSKSNYIVFKILDWLCVLMLYVSSGLAKWRLQNGLTLSKLPSTKSWLPLMKIGSSFAWLLWLGTFTFGPPLESRLSRGSTEVTFVNLLQRWVQYINLSSNHLQDTRTTVWGHHISAAALARSLVKCCRPSKPSSWWRRTPTVVAVSPPKDSATWTGSLRKSSRPRREKCEKKQPCHMYPLKYKKIRVMH